MSGRIPDPLKAALAGLLICVSLLAGVARAAPTDGVYERALLLEADRRCGLFTGDVRASLTASAGLARSAAERAGAVRTEVQAAARRGEARARATSCQSADLALAADRLRRAHAGWTQRPRMAFDAGQAVWRADRTPRDRAHWRLALDGRIGATPVTVGYATGAGETGFAAVVAFHGRPRPYAARIVARDPDRARHPDRPAARGSAPPAAPRMPSRHVWAASQGRADVALAPEGRPAQIWRFPERAAEAIAALDPRESFAVEFLFRDDSVLTVRFTAGEFAAARAFVAQG